MTNEELKNIILAKLPDTTFDETGEFMLVQIDSKSLLPLIQFLRREEALDFDYLFCLTCTDWKDHLLMSYHLLSKKHKHCVVLKAKISDVKNPSIESVASIYKTAELNEDEVFDLFGVMFLNHPNLRRLFMEDNWPGFPLRKNYTDENMIKL